MPLFLFGEYEMTSCEKLQEERTMGKRKKVAGGEADVVW